MASLAFLEPHRGRFSRWWSTLSPRERLLLRILAILAAIVLTMMLIVRPLQSARATALADIRSYETLAAQLKLAGPTLRPQAPRRSGTPGEIAQAGAASFGLTLAENAPSGGGTRVRVAGVPFDAVLRWLADLEQTSDLRVRSINLTGAGPGLVSGDVLLTP